MADVNVEFLNFGTNIRVYTDPLTSITTFVDNWVTGLTWWLPINTVFATETPSIGVAFDAVNALFWSFQGQVNPNQAIQSWCYPLVATRFSNKNQYIQLQRVKVAAGAPTVLSGGIGLFLNTDMQANSSGNGMSGWMLYTLTNAATTATLARNNGGNSVTDGIASFTYADGDTIRLEGVINSSSSVQLTGYKNGVQQFSVNENPSASFTHFGVPYVVGARINGMAGNNTGGPAQFWRNFECGLL